ncbi:MAG: response regulator, partial [Thermoanaerobaculia bacterium]
GLASLLKLEGMTVLVIGEGLRAVRAAGTFEPDAVILDLTLQDIDGIEVFRRLRKHWPHLPVVFSTGHEDVDLRIELQDNQVELLRKPFEIDDLLAALRRVTAF